MAGGATECGCAVDDSLLSSCFGGRAQPVLTPPLPPQEAALALTCRACRAAGEVKQEQAQNLLCWGLYIYRGSGPKESPPITGAYPLRWRRGYVLSHVRAGESSPHLDVAYTRFSTGPGARSWCRSRGLRSAPAPPPSPARLRAPGPWDVSGR